MIFRFGGKDTLMEVGAVLQLDVNVDNSPDALQSLGLGYAEDPDQTLNIGLGSDGNVYVREAMFNARAHLDLTGFVPAPGLDGQWVQVTDGLRIEVIGGTLQVEGSIVCSLYGEVFSLRSYVAGEAIPET